MTTQEAVRRWLREDSARWDPPALLLRDVLAIPGADSRPARQWSSRMALVIAGILLLLALIASAVLVGALNDRRFQSLIPSPSLGPSLPIVGLLPTTTPGTDATPSPIQGPTPSATQAASPAASPITFPTSIPTADPCAGLSALGAHGGATLGGWTPGPQPNASSTVTNGLIATLGFLSKGSPQTGDIYLLDPASGSQTKATDLGPFDALPRGTLDWSPSGTNLAYETYDGSTCTDLFVYSPSGLAEVPVVSGLWDNGVGWAPDESAIAVNLSAPDGTSIGLWLAAAVGGPPRDLGTFCSGLCTAKAPSWSPDGSRIAVSYSIDDGNGGQQSTIKLVNVDDGSWTTTSVGTGFQRWIDAETILVWSITDGQYATLDLGGGPTASPPPPVPTNWPPSGGWYLSPDLNYAMTWQTPAKPCACQVVVRDRATGTDQVVWTRQGASVFASWAPDSRSIILSTVTGPNALPGFWTVAVDGSGTKRITDVAGFDPYVAWQPVWP